MKIVTGSVPGIDHVRIGKNNQDAYMVHQGRITDEEGNVEEYTIGVICDGCSESWHSEVGAKIGAKLFIESVKTTFLNYYDIYDELPNGFWDGVCNDIILGGLYDFLHLMMPIEYNEEEEDESQRDLIKSVINDYMLFTIVGFLVAKGKLYIVSIGDGVGLRKFTILHESFYGKIEMDQFVTEKNQPPYIAYNLVKKDLSCDPKSLEFQIVEYDLSRVDSFLIASDGFNEIFKLSERQATMPGSDKFVPSPEFFLSDEILEKKLALQRQLNLINRPAQRIEDDRIVTEHGLLTDDTTVIAVKL